MRSQSPALSTVITLAAGVALGWLLATGMGSGRVHADLDAGPNGPRWEDREDAVASGPVEIQHDRGNDIDVKQDAIYYLDYRGGRILAAVPSYRQSVGGARMIDAFAERDLIADFKLSALKHPPHFLLVTGTVGNVKGAWAPLYVFETSTKQVASYQVVRQQVGLVSKPRFDLLQVLALPGLKMQAQAR
jgi:hypothetical protein